MRSARTIIIWVISRHSFFKLLLMSRLANDILTLNSICAVSGKWFLLTDVAKNHGGHWPTSTVLPADGRRRQKVNHCVQIELFWSDGIKTEHSSKHQIWKKAG